MNPLYLQSVQALVDQSFRNQVLVTNQMDIQHEPLYDTLTFAAAGIINGTNNRFFVNVGNATGKSLAETNMTESGKLSAPEAFSIYSFRLRWVETAFITDLVNITNSFAYRFRLLTKPYQTGPLWNYNAGAGLVGTSIYPAGAAPAATPIALISNGQNGRHAMHQLALRLPIENQMSFQGELAGDPYTLTAAASSGTGFRVCNLLDGLHAHVIQ